MLPNSPGKSKSYPSNTLRIPFECPSNALRMPKGAPPNLLAICRLVSRLPLAFAPAFAPRLNRCLVKPAPVGAWEVCLSLLPPGGCMRFLTIRAPSRSSPGQDLPTPRARYENQAGGKGRLPPVKGRGTCYEVGVSTSRRNLFAALLTVSLMRALTVSVPSPLFTRLPETS